MEWRIERLDACASTQDEALERARAGAADGTVVIADRMEAGRGRGANAWHAPEGGWYGSFVLRDLSDPRLLTLALGNAVADVLEVAGAEPRVKWVNDVLVDSRKIAGILVDAESTGGEVDFLVAGIGVNVNGTTAGWPDGLDATAITLEDVLGADSCVPDLEAFLFESIAGWVRKVRGGRGADVIAAFRARDALMGRKVAVDDAEGVAEGIDDDGRLLVSGTPVMAGTVRVVG